jgi:hypothetical protein
LCCFALDFFRYCWLYPIVISNHRFHLGSSDLILPPLHQSTSLPSLRTIHRSVMALQQSACQKDLFYRILLSLPQIVFRSTSGANNCHRLIDTEWSNSHGSIAFTDGSNIDWLNIDWLIDHRFIYRTSIHWWLNIEILIDWWSNYIYLWSDCWSCISLYLYITLIIVNIMK